MPLVSLLPPPAGCVTRKWGSRLSQEEVSNRDDGLWVWGARGWELAVGRVLRERRRYRYFLRVTMFPWFTNLKGDDAEVCQINWVQRGQ